MMQIIEQTHDEKVAMYMKSCTKVQLAEMLTSYNEILGTNKNVFVMPEAMTWTQTLQCDGTTWTG